MSAWTSYTDGTKATGGLIKPEHVNELQTALGRLEDGSAHFASTTGTNTYALDLTQASPAKAPASLTNGMLVFARIGTTNTGASTLNVNALGAKAIRKRDGSALVAGDLLAGNTYALVYTTVEDQFRILGPTTREVRTLSSQFADAGNTDAGEDDLLTYSLPGGTLARDGDYLEVEYVFTTAANGNNKQFKAYFGATAVYASTAVASNNEYLIVTMHVVRTGAATQRAWATARSPNASFAVAGPYATPGETLSGAVTVKATGEAVATNDAIQRAMTVKFWPNAI